MNSEGNTFVETILNGHDNLLEKTVFYYDKDERIIELKKYDMVRRSSSKTIKYLYRSTLMNMTRRNLLINQGVDYENIDLKSLIIGALLTLLVFSTLGLRSKTDELGHLVVRSLTIEDDQRCDYGLFG